MIIEKVPFVDDRNEKYASCQGPQTVMMVLNFFKPGLNLSFEKLYELLEYKTKTWFFETYIARFFYKLGIPVKYYCTSSLRKVDSDPDVFKKIFGLDFFNPKDKKEADVDNYDSSVDFVISKRLFEKRPIDFEFIKSLLSTKKLVIATVNRNSLEGKDGFKGHFILIKGFDENCFICNDSYLGENLKIDFDKFKKAFYSSEGVCDIVVVG